MSDALSRLIAGWIEARLLHTDRCGIAFPGGRSPIALMRTLRKQPLDWGRIDVTVVDERAVDITSEASNARLVQAEFLVDQASNATFHRLHTEKTAEASVRTLNAHQHSSPHIAVLGFGGDGHFASIFPGQMMGFESEEAFFATPALGTPCVPRISMTWRMLSAAAHLVLLVSTETKANLLHRLRRGSVQPSCPLSVPLHAGRALWVQCPNGDVECLESATPS